MNILRILFVILFLPPLFIVFPYQSMSKTLLLDDFNKKQDVKDKIRFYQCTWENPPALCETVYSSNPFYVFGNTGFSLKIKYDVTQGSNSYCGYTFRLDSLDITPYHYLSFWVRGKKGKEFFKIELKCQPTKSNRANRQARIYITDYLDTGVTTQWQKVVIPLDAFRSLEQMTNMSELTFTFERSQALENSSPLEGEIFLDDVLLGTWDPGYVRFDHFGDKLGINGFGGNGAGASVNAELNSSFLNTNDCIFPYVLQLKYKVSEYNSYVFYYNLFGGGINGFQAVPMDLSAYGKLTFWARCEKGKIDQCSVWPWQGFKIELDTDDDSRITYFAFVEVTNTWEEISVPLTNFKKNGDVRSSIDPSKIAKLAWVMDGYFLSEEDRTNTIFLDNIQFEKKDYQPDTNAPLAPSRITVNNDVLENGDELDLINKICIHAENSMNDPSLEGVYCEASRDEGLTWQRIDTDYDTADNEYYFIWDTTGYGAKQKVRLRACAMDASGNISSLMKECYISSDAKGVSRMNDLSQSILSPNSDGINDIIIFSKIKKGDRILIYSKDGQLVKTISGEDYWNGNNESGQIVDSGIYVYEIESIKQKLSGTIIVVR